MKFKLTETFLCLLLAQLFERAATYKSVKIIEFRSDFMDGAGPNTVTGKLFKTREMSFCFRLMPRYPGPYTLINTKQLTLNIRGVNSPIGFFSIRYSSMTRYSRMFTFCQTKLPGKWTSLCFAIQLQSNSQKLKIFQNGQICYNHEFPGSFASMDYQTSRPLRE